MHAVILMVTHYKVTLAVDTEHLLTEPGKQRWKSPVYRRNSRRTGSEAVTISLGRF
jgi:hypothetical protein